MSRNQQRLSDYLAHIAEAIERIDHYTADVDELVFIKTPLIQDAVIRNLEIIGEASLCGPPSQNPSLAPITSPRDFHEPMPDVHAHPVSIMAR